MFSRSRCLLRPFRSHFPAQSTHGFQAAVQQHRIDGDLERIIEKGFLRAHAQETNPLDCYWSDAAQIHKLMTEKSPGGEWFWKHLNPYPFCISKGELQKQAYLVSVLKLAIDGIVRNYNNNEALQNLITLPPKIRRAFSCENYDSDFLGTFRPDFLFDENEEINICEINARFPMNGFLLSNYGNESLEQISYLPETFTTIPHMKQLAKGLTQPFDPTQRLAILRKKEAGSDLKMFYELSSAPANTLEISPDELFVKSGVIHDKNGPLTQFILELHQDEIESLPLEMLNILSDSEKTRCLNDLRTIFIVHDKRLLHVLRDGDIMSQFLDDKHVRLLQRHVIPTWLNDSSTSKNGGFARVLDNVIDFREDYLLKPNGDGKGEGIVFGRDLSRQEWRNFLENSPREFILQRVVHQKRFDIVLKDDAEQVIRAQVPTVGTLLCQDNKFYGPGIYRAGSHQLVALSRGGTAMPVVTSSSNTHEHGSFQTVPTPLEKRKPHVARPFEIPTSNWFYFPHSDFDFSEELGEISELLTSDGFALIQLGFRDGDALFMKQICEQLGCINVHNGDRNTAIWDVRPSLDTDARSHNFAAFDMHTDCSFEDPQPSHMGLLCLREDRMDGGFFELISVNQLLNLIPEHIRDQLRQDFKFKIPKEFYKGVSHITVPILMSDDLIRYRREVIDESMCNEQQVEALDYLDLCLGTTDILQRIKLPQNSLLLMHNGMFLHSRTQVNDAQRHLKRIRFHIE